MAFRSRHGAPELQKLAVRAHRQGDVERARSLYQDLLKLTPGNLVASYNLALIQAASGEVRAAERLLQKTLKKNPKHAPSWYTLGKVHMARGRPAKARPSFEKAIRLDSGLFDAHLELVNACIEMGDAISAKSAAQRGAAVFPGRGELHHQLGVGFLSNNDFDEAEKYFNRSLEIDPELHSSAYNLGKLARKKGEFSRADSLYRRTIDLRPGFRKAKFNLAHVLLFLGRVEESSRIYLDILKTAPNDLRVVSNYLMNCQYQPGVTPFRLRDRHKLWERHCASRPPTDYAHARDPDKRLRIGFVSPDFRRHPVGYFAIGYLEHRDPSQTETLCYSDVPDGDEMTERFRRASDEWRDTHELSNEQLCERIAKDRVDVLVDLAGHTAGNRLWVFSRKPAPVQVSWAGYVGTTGASTMDAVIADRFQVRRQDEECFNENVVRLPHDYVSYEPPSDAPDPSPPPSSRNGFVTFGSFNNVAKVNDEVIALWSRIMAEVTGSRLVLKYRGFNDSGVQDRIATQFEERGVERRRLIMEGHVPQRDLLARYNDIDVALDTMPYSGGLTTLEALWMGVPVITMPGETFAGRHSFTHLSNAGLDGMIASDSDDYVRVATEWAENERARGELRSILRDRLRQSPICDHGGFARDLTAALRGLWREWCLQKVA